MAPSWGHSLAMCPTPAFSSLLSSSLLLLLLSFSPSNLGSSGITEPRLSFLAFLRVSSLGHFPEPPSPATPFPSNQSSFSSLLPKPSRINTSPVATPSSPTPSSIGDFLFLHQRRPHSFLLPQVTKTPNFPTFLCLLPQVIITRGFLRLRTLSFGFPAIAGYSTSAITLPHSSLASSFCRFTFQNLSYPTIDSSSFSLASPWFSAATHTPNSLLASVSSFPSSFSSPVSPFSFGHYFPLLYNFFPASSSLSFSAYRHASMVSSLPTISLSLSLPPSPSFLRHGSPLPLLLLCFFLFFLGLWREEREIGFRGLVNGSGRLTSRFGVLVLGGLGKRDGPLHIH